MRERTREKQGRGVELKELGCFTWCCVRRNCVYAVFQGRSVLDIKQNRCQKKGAVVEVFYVSLQCPAVCNRESVLILI